MAGGRARRDAGPGGDVGRSARRRARRRTPQAKAGGDAFKVALVTDIGGLDDRSFNFLANKGLQRAKKTLGVAGPRVHLEVERRLRPEPRRRGCARTGRPRDRGRLPDGRRGRRRSPSGSRDEVRDHRQLGRRGELKGKPTNVRGLLFKEQEAGYLVGFLAAQQVSRSRQRPDEVGAVGGLKIPPVDRFIAGYYAGAKKAKRAVTVTLTATRRTSSTRRSARSRR